MFVSREDDACIKTGCRLYFADCDAFCQVLHARGMIAAVDALDEVFELRDQPIHGHAVIEDYFRAVITVQCDRTNQIRGILVGDITICPLNDEGTRSIAVLFLNLLYGVLYSRAYLENKSIKSKVDQVTANNFGD